MWYMLCMRKIMYTTLDRVIGLLTKYFKHKLLLKLHLPVGDVPFPFPCNWSNNVRGHPLSRIARDMTKSKIWMHITAWNCMTSQETNYFLFRSVEIYLDNTYIYIDIKRIYIFSYIFSTTLIIDYLQGWYANFFASKCLFKMFALSRWIFHRINGH